MLIPPDGPKPPRCRHRRHWVFADVLRRNQMLWCYECGAIRHVSEGGRWVRPVGPGGENPAMKRGAPC